MFSYVPTGGTFEIPKNSSSNLTETKNLRDIKYRADGTGRDAHIHFSNGGMNIEF